MYGMLRAFFLDVSIIYNKTMKWLNPKAKYLIIAHPRKNLGFNFVIIQKTILNFTRPDQLDTIKISYKIFSTLTFLRVNKNRIRYITINYQSFTNIACIIRCTIQIEVRPSTFTFVFLFFLSSWPLAIKVTKKLQS